MIELHVDQQDEPIVLHSDGSVSWQPRLLDAPKLLKLLVDEREIEVLVER